MRFGLLLLCLAAPGCGPRLLDACADPRSAEASCVNLVLSGDLGELNVLGVTTSGAWTGYAEVVSELALRLPATLGVALPRALGGPVRLEVGAYLGRRRVGEASTTLTDLTPGEHRQLELELTPR